MTEEELKKFKISKSEYEKLEAEWEEMKRLWWEANGIYD